MIPRLQTSALIVRYPTGFQVGPVELDLGPGVHHLQGRNGAGKTTLLRCLVGALPPSAGRALVCGHDPRRWRARRRVAYSPAGCDLPGFLTVDEAWSLAAAARGRPGWDGAALRDHLGLPGDLRIAHGSAGQRRLAGLLEALAGDPEVLLVDEPLASVDETTCAAVGALLARLGRSRVVLVTSHEPPTFRVDTAGVLARGRPMRWIRRPDLRTGVRSGEERSECTSSSAGRSRSAPRSSTITSPGAGTGSGRPS